MCVCFLVSMSQYIKETVHAFLLLFSSFIINFFLQVLAQHARDVVL